MRVSVATLVAMALAATITTPTVRLKADTAGAQTQQKPLPKGQMPELGRPTKVGDELPLFDFDAYFAGTWTFEWDMPEGALGESGRVNGTTVYTVVEAGKSYRAETEATGPGGAFKVHELIAYQKEQKTISRKVTDSRGLSYEQTGTIGGDLGGIYNILLDGSPFTYHGHTLRIKHALRTMSPFNYKVATTVSVDGAPYRNYGNPWWRKDTTGAK